MCRRHRGGIDGVALGHDAGGAVSSRAVQLTHALSVTGARVLARLLAEPDMASATLEQAGLALVMDALAVVPGRWQSFAAHKPVGVQCQGGMVFGC